MKLARPPRRALRRLLAAAGPALASLPLAAAAVTLPGTLPLPDSPPTVIPLATPAPPTGASPAPLPLPGLQPSVPLLPGTGGSGGSQPAGEAAAAPSPQPSYQPSAGEQAALPSEPGRVEYEAQQARVLDDLEQLDGSYSQAAVEAGGGSGRFGWPIVFRGHRPPLTQPFGCTNLAGEPYNPACPTKRWHTGIDLAVPAGSPVFASDSGVARTFRSSAGYGDYVIVTHGNGYATLYAHLSAFAVADGQVVRRGEMVGLSGSTGFSTGPHLHFEIRWERTYVDPCEALSGC
jgi:murein DD-endopeptidase MepM/ murein hydrolase activator NlpD